MTLTPDRHRPRRRDRHGNTRDEREYMAILTRVVERDEQGKATAFDIDAVEVTGKSQKDAHRRAKFGREGDWIVEHVSDISDMESAIDAFCSHLQAVPAHSYRVHLLNDRTQKVDIFVVYAPEVNSARTLAKLEGLRRYGDAGGYDWMVQKVELVPSNETFKAGIVKAPVEKEVPVEKKAEEPTSRRAVAAKAITPKIEPRFTATPKAMQVTPTLNIKSNEEKRKERERRRLERRAQAALADKTERERRRLEKIDAEKRRAEQNRIEEARRRTGTPSKTAMAIAFEEARHNHKEDKPTASTVPVPAATNTYNNEATTEPMNQMIANRMAAKGQPTFADNLTTGELIKKYREWVGISQDDLGKLIEPPMAGSNVSYWERADHPPTLDMIARFARAFGVPVSALSRGSMSRVSRAPRRVAHRTDQYDLIRIANNVRTGRISRNWTQAELYKHSNVNQSAISRAERAGPLEFSYYDGLARAFGVSVDTLLTGDRSELMPTNPKVPLNLIPVLEAEPPAGAPKRTVNSEDKARVFTESPTPPARQPHMRHDATPAKGVAPNVVIPPAAPQRPVQPAMGDSPDIDYAAIAAAAKAPQARTVMSDREIEAIEAFSKRTKEAAEAGMMSPQIPMYLDALLKERTLLLNTIARISAQAAIKGGG